MHPGVLISGLLLLLTGAVDSYREVSGVVGRPVTLPCTYMAAHGISHMCWGQGLCPYSKCSRYLIRTDGYRVTYQRNSRYQLKGNIPEGNVSLTIENSVQRDSGLYCCRVEIPGLFNDQKINFRLQLRPVIPTRPPTRPTTTTKLTTIRPTTTRPTTTARPITTAKPTTTARLTTTARPTATARPTTVRLTTARFTTARPTSTRSIEAPTSTSVLNTTPPIPAQTQTPKPVPTIPSLPQTTEPQPTAEGTLTLICTPTEDWNDTVSSSEEPWSNHTEAIPIHKPKVTASKGFIIGISIAVLVLLILVSAVAVAKYIYMKKKTGSLSLVASRVSKISALKSTVLFRPRVEDKVCIIDDSIYATE